MPMYVILVVVVLAVLLVAGLLVLADRATQVVRRARKRRDAAARSETCLVVTADRELRRRCEELNASVVGPGWLLRLL